MKILFVYQYLFVESISDVSFHKYAAETAQICIAYMFKSSDQHQILLPFTMLFQWEVEKMTLYQTEFIFA